jgi:hypothetical protein
MTLKREFKKWESESWSVLKPLMAALNAAVSVRGRGPDAVLSVSDQFRAVAHEATSWISTYPCPIADLNVVFARTVRSCSELAAALDGEAKNSRGIDWPVFDREVAGIHLALADTLTKMSDLADD